MARTFGYSDQYARCDLGSVAGIASGTFVTLIRINSDLAGYTKFISAYDADLEEQNGPFLDGSHQVFYTATSSITLTASDGWTLLAVGKVIGGDDIVQKYTYSDRTFVGDTTPHGTEPETITDGRIYLGALPGYVSCDCDLAAAMILKDRVITDDQFLRLTQSLQAWHDLKPEAMWILDQDSTSTKILDVTGNGSNEYDLTGTSVSTRSVPISYGNSIWVPTWRTSGGSSSATVTPDAVTCPATIPSATTTTSATVTPGVVQAVTTAPSPTVRISAAITPAAVQGAAVIPAEVTTTGSTCNPTVVAGITTVPAATTTTGSTATPTVVPATATAGTPAIWSSALVSPAVVSGVAVVDTPTVSESPVVAASVVVASATVGSCGVVTSSTVSPATVGVVAGIDGVTVPVSASVAVSSVSCPVTAGGVTVSGGMSSTVAAGAVGCLCGIGSVSVSTGASSTASPVAVSVTALVPQPWLSAAMTSTPLLVGVGGTTGRWSVGMVHS